MRKISHWWIIFLLLTKVKHLNGATLTTDSGAISSVTTTVSNEASSQPTTPTTSFTENAASVSSTSTTSTASSNNPTYTSSPWHPTSTTFQSTTVTETTTTLTTNPMSSSTNAKDNGSPTAETTGTGTTSFPPSTTPVSTNETSTNASTSSVTGSESSSIASTSPSPSTTSSNNMTTSSSTSPSTETVSTSIITTTPSSSQTTPISDNTTSSSQTTSISDNTPSSSQTTSVSDNTTSSSQTTPISVDTTSSIESTTGAVATSTTDSDTTITTSVQSSSEYATTSQPHATSSVSFQTSTKQPTTTSSITPPSTTTTTTTKTTSTATPEQSTAGKTNKTPSIKDQQLYYAASGAAVVVLAVVVILVLVLVKMRRRHKWCFSTDVELYNSFEDSMELDYIHFRPGPVKLQDFSAYLDKLHRNDNLLFVDAFTLLHEDSPSGVSSAAMLEKNEDKNRYVNILAFDHSRVKLRQINDDQTTDYINANFLPGYTYRREYIATQGPLPNTLDDFWRMIWEQNVEIIVMVTKLVENGNPKCDKYWPDIGNVSVHGDFTVTTKTEVNNSKFTLRTLEMTKAGEKPRSIRQYAFLLWPDMGVPETPSALLEFVQAVRSGAPRKEAGPIVVHCSAGVGRTGTFIAVDHLLQMIRKNDEIDVFGQVMEMRKYRASMVQTEAQFVFIYDCIKDFMMTDDEHGEATEDEDEEIKEDEKVEADRMLKPALGQDNPAFEDTVD